MADSQAFAGGCAVTVVGAGIVIKFLVSTYLRVCSNFWVDAWGSI